MFCESAPSNNNLLLIGEFPCFSAGFYNKICCIDKIFSFVIRSLYILKLFGTPLQHKD